MIGLLIVFWGVCPARPPGDGQRRRSFHSNPTVASTAPVADLSVVAPSGPGPLDLTEAKGDLTGAPKRAADAHRSGLGRRRDRDLNPEFPFRKQACWRVFPGLRPTRLGDPGDSRPVVSRLKPNSGVRHPSALPPSGRGSSRGADRCPLSSLPGRWRMRARAKGSGAHRSP